jgi:predicted NAD/FAD-dependent oxidoreductase
VLPGFDWSTLYAADGIEGANRLSEQYLRVNIAPSERYVQSLVGSTQYRLFVESAGVDGLYPVGDWVNTGINSGDIEAATISGLQAARAVTGKSRPIVHEGDG